VPLPVEAQVPVDALRIPRVVALLAGQERAPVERRALRRLDPTPHRQGHVALRTLTLTSVSRRIWQTRYCAH